ncbi:hypothetical protein [Streptomyces rochei]|uniref:hypothetical protein n=1 Tax=Streptomyces rochei TaxID=1928 RepID=UPI004062918F
MPLADELRTAAEKLRTLTAEATPGPWHTVAYDPSWAGDFDAGISTRPNGELDVVGHGYEGGGVERLSDAQYIAAMHPGVGTLLAQLLDVVAEHVTDDVVAPTHIVRAVLVARAINGGAQ